MPNIIYITKKQQKELDMYNLLIVIKKELKLTKTNLAEKSQLHKFNSKWGELYNNL